MRFWELLENDRPWMDHGDDQPDYEEWTPERGIDNFVRTTFSAGGCAELALALHEKTGWPLHAEMNRDPEFSDMIEHVWVVNPQGRAVDINGVHPEAFAQSKYNDPEWGPNKANPRWNRDIGKRGNVVQVSKDQMTYDDGLVEWARELVAMFPGHFGLPARLTESADSPKDTGSPWDTENWWEPKRTGEGPEEYGGYGHRQDDDPEGFYHRFGVPAEVENRYSYAQCTYLAYAMNERYGWQIKAEMYRAEPTHIAHAYCVMPDGREIDILGPQDKVDSFDGGEVRDFTPQEMLDFIMAGRYPKAEKEANLTAARYAVELFIAPKVEPKKPVFETARGSGRKFPGKKFPGLTPEFVQKLKHIRHECRIGNGGGGACHLVSEWLDDEYGWERFGGAYLSPDGAVIDSFHLWNYLPDGSILDATADQHGEGYDIRVISPTDPDYARYRPEWSDDYHPGMPEYDREWPAPHSTDAWTGESDWDHSIRVDKERGPLWSVTDREQWDRYSREQWEKYGLDNWAHNGVERPKDFK